MSRYFAKVLRSKILSLAGKNTNDKVDLEWIFARNCEGTKKLLKKHVLCDNKALGGKRIWIFKRQRSWCA